MLCLPIGDFKYGEFASGKTPKSAVALARKDRPVMWASDHGSYTIYHNGETWIGEFDQWRITKARCEAKSKGELLEFMTVNWPRYMEAK